MTEILQRTDASVGPSSLDDGNDPARPPRLRRRNRPSWRAGVDLAVLAVACLLCSIGADRAGVPAPAAGWMALYCVGVVISIAGRGGYRFRLDSSPLDHLVQVYVSTTLSAMLLVGVQVFVAPGPDIAESTVRLWVFSWVLLLFAKIVVAVSVRRTNRRGQATLIVGAGSVGQTVARRLSERPELGLRPVGFLDKEPLGIADGLPVLGASWDLEQVVADKGVKHVIVTFSTAPHVVLLELVRRCRALGVEVSHVPRLYEEVSGRANVEHLGGIALLRVEQTDPRGWQFAVKYAADRVVGGLALFAVAPLLIGLAIAVRLSSPGPILYRQRRTGLDGHQFDLLKFRTMREPREGEVDDWAALALGDADAPGPIDRRTPLGRVLRRWSLDELPQLINVTRGDMSLVGPRPELPGYVERFERHIYRYGDRHRVKSGLTGWAQVQGLRGSESSLADRIEWDNTYIENWSPWLDLKILLLTVPAVFSGRGAA